MSETRIQGATLDDSSDVELTVELLEFMQAVKDKAKREWNKGDAGRLETPFHALLVVLKSKYENKLATLVSRAKKAGENIKLSTSLAEVFTKQNLSTPTARKYATLLKRILSTLDMPLGFVESLRLVGSLKQSAPDKTLCKFGALPKDDPGRNRLEKWVEIIRNGTRSQSVLSIRNIISFYLNACLPALDLDLYNWPEDVATHLSNFLSHHPHALSSIVGDAGNSVVKTGRLKFLLNDVLETNIEVPKSRKRPAPIEDGDDDDGHDAHRISSEHLELLYQAASKELLDELIFLLMLTTGLRIAGVSKILTRNIADIKADQYAVKEQGKTKEKGNKFAFFVICPRVKYLIEQWLKFHRSADNGPFLFPGQIHGGHISTDCIRQRFKRLCQTCGLEGREFHPHALRHTNAHILLECGNSVEAVSKCLNHRSSSTTQKFYLSESAVEVQARCNIPWAHVETEAEKRQRALDSLPSFLKDGVASSAKNKSKNDKESKTQRRAEKKALLESFRPL